MPNPKPAGTAEHYATEETSITRLANQRHLFSLPKDVVYLNCASRSPMLQEVERIGHEAVSRKNEPWRISSDGVEERVRKLFAKLIRASIDEVALTPSTSYAISQAAYNILRLRRAQAGDSVLVVQNQMSSNVYPWQHLCREVGAQLIVVPFPVNGDWTDAILACMQRIRNAGCHVAVVAVPHFLWTDGSGPVDLERIGSCCALSANTDRGKTVLVVDATQSLGVVPIDVHLCQIDWLACSVHKWLFAPYGLSFSYVSEEWCMNPQSQPLVQDEHNRAGADGDKVLPFILDPPGYSEEFQAGARRFDAGGRPNPILLPMIEAALKQVLHWRPECIEATIRPLVKRAVAGAQQLGLSTPPCHAPHIVGIGPGPVDGAVEWADSASAFLKARGVMVSARAGVLRVAPHVYNDMEDVDLLIDGLRAFLHAKERKANL